jgi:hypothetical protein
MYHLIKAYNYIQVINMPSEIPSEIKMDTSEKIENTMTTHLFLLREGLFRCTGISYANNRTSTYKQQQLYN